MKDDKNFVSRIKILIGGDSPTAFAKKCGVDPKSIRRALEEKIPGEVVLKKIENATGKSREWILGSEDINDDHSQHQLSESGSEYNTGIEDSFRKTVIAKLDTVIRFLEESYADLPLRLDDCIVQMKTDLLKNPDFRQWKYSEEEELIKRRKKQSRESDQIDPQSSLIVNNK